MRKSVIVRENNNLPEIGDIKIGELDTILNHFTINQAAEFLELPRQAKDLDILKMLTVIKATGANPLLGEIHFWEQGGKYICQPHYKYYMKIAQKDPRFKKLESKITETTEDGTPHKCIARLMFKDGDSVEQICIFNDVAKRDFNGNLQNEWSKQPRHMFEKQTIKILLEKQYMNLNIASEEIEEDDEIITDVVDYVERDLIPQKAKSDDTIKAEKVIAEIEDDNKKEDKKEKANLIELITIAFKKLDDGYALSGRENIEQLKDVLTRAEKELIKKNRTDISECIKEIWQLLTHVGKVLKDDSTDEINRILSIMGIKPIPTNKIPTLAELEKIKTLIVTQKPPPKDDKPEAQMSLIEDALTAPKKEVVETEKPKVSAEMDVTIGLINKKLLSIDIKIDDLEAEYPMLIDLLVDRKYITVDNDYTYGTDGLNALNDELKNSFNRIGKERLEKIYTELCDKNNYVYNPNNKDFSTIDELFKVKLSRKIILSDDLYDKAYSAIKKVITQEKNKKVEKIEMTVSEGITPEQLQTLKELASKLEYEEDEINDRLKLTTPEKLIIQWAKMAEGK